MNPTEILKQHGIKKTTPRVAIIQALQKGGGPLTEAEIHDAMGDLYDRITFYRSIQKMEEVGILHKIVVNNVLVKYALNNCSDGDKHETHAHFYCLKCNKVSCLGSFDVDINLPEGCIQYEAELLIKGICKDCIE